jgi:hypothetical protein
VVEVRIKLWIFPLVIFGLAPGKVLLRRRWRRVVVFCSLPVVREHSISFSQFGKLFLCPLNVIQIFILD